MPYRPPSSTKNGTGSTRGSFALAHKPVTREPAGTAALAAGHFLDDAGLQEFLQPAQYARFGHVQGFAEIARRPIDAQPVAYLLQPEQILERLEPQGRLRGEIEHHARGLERAREPVVDFDLHVADLVIFVDHVGHLTRKPH